VTWSESGGRLCCGGNLFGEDVVSSVWKMFEQFASPENRWTHTQEIFFSTS